MVRVFKSGNLQLIDLLGGVDEPGRYMRKTGDLQGRYIVDVEEPH